MRKITAFIFFFILPGVLFAQADLANGSVKRVKRNVEVRFDISTASKSLKNRYKMVLTPYLYRGTDTAWLQEVEIYGRIRYRRERQEAALGGNKDWKLLPNQILEGDTLAYLATVPYAKWMRKASLGVNRRMVGCACDCYDGDQTLLKNAPVYIPPVPSIPEVASDPSKFEVVDAHKRWAFDSEEIKVFFPVSKIVLYAGKYGNQATLDKIIEGICKIGGTEKLRLNGVEITGFASPEGGVALNTRLGEGRAKALKAYIREQMPELRDEDFRLINGVENWDGLRRMVAGADMEYRDEVLNILDNYTGAARKAALQRLGGGKPYRYMLKTFYPELRNACYVAVYYDVLNDVAAEAVNAANAMIRAGKYDEALGVLLRHKDDDRAWNSIGVCYMMLEEEDEAIGWFEKAVEAGRQGAYRNLEQLK